MALTSIYQSEVFSFLNNAKIHRWMSQTELDYFCFARTQTVFYSLPKIHKSIRQIVAQTNALLSPLGQYVDFSITMFVHLLPSYIRDSTDLLIQNGCV